MSKSEWERGTRGYTVVSEADIGMADAAAGNLCYHVVGPRLKSEEFVSLQTLSWSSQSVAVAASRGRQKGSPPAPRLPLTAILGEQIQYRAATQNSVI